MTNSKENRINDDFFLTNMLFVDWAT